MSEGWNIAVLGATGAVGETLLETLAERQFPVGKFMHWHVTKAQANNCALVVRQSPMQDAAEFDWTQAQLSVLSQAKKLPLPGLKKRPTQVAW